MRKEDPKFIEKRKKFYAEQKQKSQDKYSKGGLSPKQKVIAAKAPPPNKITGADFAALKKEKVMKAKRGDFFERRLRLGGVDPKKFPTIKTAPGSIASKAEKKQGTKKLGEFLPRRLKLVGSILSAAGAGAVAQKLIDKMKNKKKKKELKGDVKGSVSPYLKKKMGGGMMKKPMGYVSGGPAEESDLAKRYSAPGLGPRQYEKPFLKFKPKVRNARGQGPNKPRGPARPAASGPKKTEDFANKSKFKKYNVSGSDLTIVLKDAGKKLSGLTPLGGVASAYKKYKNYQDDKKSRNPNPKTPKMYGGGMMNKPMGYKSGKSIKVKCKLGKNKPTKMY